MALYFFDLIDGDTVIEDKSGVDLADVAAAREEAEALAAIKVAERQAPAEPFDPRELYVRAETGRCVAKIALRYIST